MRYTLFSNLHQFYMLKAELDGGVESLNYYDLTEMFAGLDDMLPTGPHGAIGRVLFDEEEAATLAILLDMPVEWKMFAPEWDQTVFPTWEETSVYLRTPEFRAVLVQAAKCLDTMLGPGRGIPGWGPSDWEGAVWYPDGPPSAS